MVRVMSYFELIRVKYFFVMKDKKDNKINVSV